MTIDPPSRLRSLSRNLALAWFGLVGVATVAGALFVFIPNEALTTFGRLRCMTYALAFILLVAIVGLPLLVAAALLNRKGRRPPE